MPLCFFTTISKLRWVQRVWRFRLRKVGRIENAATWHTIAVKEQNVVLLCPQEILVCFGALQPRYECFCLVWKQKISEKVLFFGPIMPHEKFGLLLVW